MTQPDQQILFFSTLLQLEKQARLAKDQTELIYTIVNETVRLIKYRQAMLWMPNFRGIPTIKSVSGVDTHDRHAPFISYANTLLRHIKNIDDEPQQVTKHDLPEALKDGWTEWSFGTVFSCPLITPKGDLLGGIIFVRDGEWQEAETTLVVRILETYAHALEALRGKKNVPGNKLFKSFPKRILQLFLLAVVILVMDQPVRLSVLAPMEVIPYEPLLVTSPLPSVIESFSIEPNQKVKKGDLLFSLDNTNTRNQHQVAIKALAVMETEYTREKQKSFKDPKSRAILLNIEASIDQKKTEIAYIKELMRRSEVFAGRDGLAVFKDTQDWLGRPVMVGEKILTIADPQKVEVEIMLPVADAITLEKGAKTLVFLNIKPDQPLKAELRQASFEAIVTQDGILSFKLKATLGKNKSLPRIGLRGTAKIYGEQVSLFYYLMRKPLIAVRQKLGM